MLFLFWLLLLSVVSPQGSSANEGTKVVLRVTSGEHISEIATYTMGDRKRTESRNSVQWRNAAGVLVTADPRENVAIARCDLGLRYGLNTKAKEYTEYALIAYPPNSPRDEEKERAKEREWSESPLPLARIEKTTVDTGERKEFFGHVARHIITTVKQTNVDGTNKVTDDGTWDGWYIDFDQTISCSPRIERQVHGYALGWRGRGPIAKTELIEIGRPEGGFAVKMVVNPGNITHEVMELSEGPIDPILFEIPPDFKSVDHIQ
jgi:hypothetical protein